MSRPHMEGQRHWIRDLLSAWAPRVVHAEDTCCVPGCSRPPAMVVAARRSTSKWMCSQHATRWLASDEGFAAQGDQSRSFALLARWVAAAAETTTTHGVHPPTLRLV